MAKRNLNEQSYDDGVYAAGKKKKFGLLAFLLCVVISFVIWIYVTNQQNNKELDDSDVKNGTTAMIDTEHSFDNV